MLTFHLIVLLSVAGLSSSVLQVVPYPNLVITQGSTSASFTVLSCIVRPPQYTVTWLHAGTALSSMERYSISNGSVYNDTTYGSILQIQLLSYSDAGNYTCMIQPSPANGSESYSATIQLILLVKLEVLGPTNIMVNATTTSQVELSCEMSQYIHPDGDLWWFRGGQKLDNTQSKYSIGYQNGNKLAQYGGSGVTSRVSVLTISQLTSSDSGVYTCKLFGTDQSGDINLTVMDTPLSTSATTHGVSVGFFAIALVGLLILVMVVLMSVCVHHKVRKLKPQDPNTIRRGQTVPRANPYSDARANPYSDANSSLQSNSATSRQAVEPVHKVSHTPPLQHKNTALSLTPTPSLPPPPAMGTHPTVSVSTTQSIGVYDVLRHKNIPDDFCSLVCSHGESCTSSLTQSFNTSRDSSSPCPTRSYSDSHRRPTKNPIYCERLEPSMLLQKMHTQDMPTQPLPFAPLHDNPKPLRQYEQPILITKDHIIEFRDLGVGQFGQVVLAGTKGLSPKDLRLGHSTDKDRSLLVAIKKLRQDADGDLRKSFECEIKFMSRLTHSNVVRLLGVCQGVEPFLVMEYMENGDLHGFLRKHKVVPDTVDHINGNEVTPLILMYVAVQIANGMRYLASRKFVHRDLATRNCLVGRDFVVKVSDFGMSCNLYQSFYYLVQGRLILPIRWMAFESFYGKFSVKSDAWSYGVTMWEIFTLALSEPYCEMSDEEVIADAIKGATRRLLPAPSACAKEVYDVMLRCWMHEPVIRADFEEIYSRMFLLYTQMSQQFE